MVSKGWSDLVDGHMMFQVTQKLKRLKPAIREKMWNKGNIHNRVVLLRKELDTVQTDPYNITLQEEESVYMKEFNNVVLEEESFLKQKANIDWLRDGDINTKYFHVVIKDKQHRGKINSIYGLDVPRAFVDHYKSFIGADHHTSDFITESLFTRNV